jgi:hypothetical protein
MQSTMTSCRATTTGRSGKRAHQSRWPYCPTCQQETIPLRSGRCGWCGVRLPANARA